MPRRPWPSAATATEPAVPASARNAIASLVDFFMVFSCCIVTPDAVRNGLSGFPSPSFPFRSEQKVEMASHLLRRLVDVRFKHAEFWQVGCAQHQVRQTRRHVVAVERPG